MISYSDIAQYAAENPNITKLLNNGKLQFVLTGMEFAPNTKREVLEAYVGGRAYRRAIWARENEGYDFTQHEPYIVPHMFRDEHNFLFCRLTDSTLPRRKECIQNHVSGKRYQRRLNEAEDARAESQRLEAKGKGMDRMKRSQNDSRGQSGVKGDSDVLAGILSASDDAMEVEASDVINDYEADMDDAKELTKQETVERLDQQEEDGSVFWTRGRGSASTIRDYANDSELDDDDEWNKTPRNSRNIEGGAIQNRKGVMHPLPVLLGEEKAMSDGQSVAVETTSTAVVTGKRARTGRPMKKVRRLRQRRKTGAAST